MRSDLLQIEFRGRLSQTSSSKDVFTLLLFTVAVADSPFCPALHTLSNISGDPFICLSFIVSVNSLLLFLCIRRHARFAVPVVVYLPVYCTPPPSPRPFLCPLYRTLLQ